MLRPILLSVRAALAPLVVLGALLCTTSCTYTVLAFTPVEERKPSQYKWLIADAAITTALLIPGLLVENETAKVGLLSAAGAWGGLTLLIVPLMVVPGGSRGLNPGL